MKLLFLIVVIGIIIFIYKRVKEIMATRQNVLFYSKNKKTNVYFLNHDGNADFIGKFNWPKIEEEKESQHLVLEYVNEYNDLLNSLKSMYLSSEVAEKMLLERKDRFSEICSIKIDKNSEAYKKRNELQIFLRSLLYNLDDFNRCFVEKEIKDCDILLSNIDGKSLDHQQREVVVSDDTAMLVIAGAGSGKTLTIAGKVKYLVSRLNVDPNDILLISYTKKAAEELSNRIIKNLNIPVTATTFHKLGFDIIKSVSDKSFDICDSMEKTANEFFESVVKNDKYLSGNLIQYFSYYFVEYMSPNKYKKLGDYYETQKSMNCETIKSKLERWNIERQYIDEKRTFQGEYVKSNEELMIANFLYLNGVEYEYERPYPYESPDNTRRIYKPDFYLKDYDVYLEHFGVDKHGRCQWLPPIAEDKYLDDMKWKREFHKQNGTKLLETYSYYNSDDGLLEKLKTLLVNNGVVLEERDSLEIYEKLYINSGEEYLREFIKLCCSFITLFKSKKYSVDDFETMKNKAQKLETSFYNVKRTTLFLDICCELYKYYTAFLEDNRSIDFTDMIIKSTECVHNGAVINNYKYIIVDEYQDISSARAELIKAIVNATGAKLMCVGDDWQSIFRFAGSDINLFCDFSSCYKYSKEYHIEKTYRNSQQLIDIASEFIMKNKKQLSKTLSSEKSLIYPISIWKYSNNPFQTLKRMTDKLISGSGSDKSILFLGRTSYDYELLKQSDLFSFKKYGDEEKIIYKNSPDTPVSFLTVHKAKGLEADNVIILNFKNTILGFPNRIADDPLLKYVLNKPEDYPYAEERRLFYVALTRARNRVFILAESDSVSEFYKDLKDNKDVYIVSDDKQSTVMCPICKSGVLRIVNNESNDECFVGCSNYPLCSFTTNHNEIMYDNKRCPWCDSFLVERNGVKGKFLGCLNYPSCTFTREIN